jgi:hypothetical protein
MNTLCPGLTPSSSLNACKGVSAASSTAAAAACSRSDSDSPGSKPGDPDYPGGGWIPTIVIANHGPRALTEFTPFNHYSLLRTLEDGFGLTPYLGHAADEE